MFRKLFGTRGPEPDLQRKADELVSMAHAMSVGSYTTFGERLPLIFEFSTDEWDFFLTVGKVFVAMSALEALEAPDSVKEPLADTVVRNLMAWEPDAVRAFEDCKGLFEKTYDSLSQLDEYRDDARFLGADSVGTWIAWNLLKHAPTSHDEGNLVRLLGLAATHGFVSWWRPAA